MTITAALERDVAFRAASWRTKVIYAQLRRHARIEAPPGGSIAEALVFTLKGLSATPLVDVEEALVEMCARALLVAAPDGSGALVPKHAPKPRAAPRRRAPGAPLSSAVPEGVDPHRYGAFRAWASRLDATEKTLPFEDLWARHSEVYRPRRRATDPGETPPSAPPVVTTAPPPAVTTPPVVTAPVTTGAPSAVTSTPSEGGPEGEKESLSLLPGKQTEETSQHPRARDPRPGVLVTSTVTTVVTSDAPAAPAALTLEDLKRALNATGGRVGSSGAEDRLAVLKVFVDEEFTREELGVFVRLAKTRALYLQEKHSRVSLHFVLRDGAAILHRWIDDVRAEVARQLALGLAANDPRTGSATAAPRAPPRPAATTDASTPTTVAALAPGDVLGALSFAASRRVAR